MLAVAGLIYSALFSFVWSAAERNRREARAHPMMLTYVGYVLCGLTGALAVFLPVWAVVDPAGAAAFADLTLKL